MSPNSRSNSVLNALFSRLKTQLYIDVWVKKTECNINHCAVIAECHFKYCVVDIYIIIPFIYSLYIAFIHSAAIFYLHFCSIMYWCMDGAALPISWCARSYDDNKGFDFDLKLDLLAIDVTASTSWVKRLCELPFLFETRLRITWLNMTKDLSKCLPVLLAAKMKANSAARRLSCRSITITQPCVVAGAGSIIYSTGERTIFAGRRMYYSLSSYMLIHGACAFARRDSWQEWWRSKESICSRQLIKQPLLPRN